MIIHLKNQRKTRMMKRTRTAIWWKVTGPSSSFFFCKTSHIASLSPNFIGFLGGNKRSSLSWSFYLDHRMKSKPSFEFRMFNHLLLGKPRKKIWSQSQQMNKLTRTVGKAKAIQLSARSDHSWKQKIPPGKVERGAGPKKGAHHPLQNQIRSCAGQGSHLDRFTLESLLLETIFRNENRNWSPFALLKMK